MREKVGMLEDLRPNCHRVLRISLQFDEGLSAQKVLICLLQEDH